MTAAVPLRADVAAPPGAGALDVQADGSPAATPRLGSRTWRRVVVVGDLLSATAVLGLLATSGSALDARRVVVAVAAWLAALVAAGAYDTTRVRSWPAEVRRVLWAAMGLAAALPLVELLAGRPADGALNVTITAAALGAGTIALRWLVRAVGEWLTGGRVGALRVVVAGHRRDVSRIVAELDAAGSSGYDVVAVCDISPSSPGAELMVVEAVRSTSADAVVVAPCRHLDPATLRRLGWLLEHSRAMLLVSTSLLDVSPGRAQIAHAGGLPLVSVRSAGLHGASRMLKELAERTLAAVALVVLSPLLIAIAVLIRIDSPGPAIFRQVRAGKHGLSFSMLKFRTMSEDAEALRPELEHLSSPGCLLFKLRDDPRITRVGRVLRRYSLDELPQLVNVLRGQMALVGPRPPLLEEVEQYEPDVLRRLAVKPGITGLWQVSGRSDLSWEESVRLDLRYVDNWSLGRDAAIVARTFGAVLGHRGAY